MAEFEIDPRISASTEPLAQLRLSEARLQADRRWPWIVLSPRKPGAIDLEHLAAADRATLMDEILAAGAAVRAMGAALGRPVDKLNIGQLGNRVEQLHVHVVGRRRDDPAWPDPVWGFGQAIPYDDKSLASVRAAALAALERVKRK